MELKIALCDDEPADRQYIAELTERWARQAGHQARIACFPSAESFLFDYEDRSGYDLLLLDIELGGMDGVSLAKELRRKNETVQLVFITGYSDYIAEGYEVEALHYLMKPVQPDKLFSVLDRAVEKLRANEKLLVLERGGETVRIPLYQIRWAAVSGNYVTVYGKEPHTAKMPLGELEKQLDGRFYRVGRSSIVNLYWISRVTKTEILLTDGASVPLPRGAYEGVNRAIISMR